MGDAHMAQGDSELDGTGIETSITGKFKLEVVKAVDFGDMEAALDFPLGETATHWIVHSFTEIDYLETYAANPGDIYGASSIDDAMKNCYTQTRKFLMAKYGLTDPEAATFITVGVDFATTQLVDGRVLLYAIDATPARSTQVDGNWGVHAEIPKAMFEAAA